MMRLAGQGKGNSVGTNREGGLAWLDADHDGLVHLMDALVEAVKNPERGDAVQDLLLQLVDASTDHFTSEHDLMRSIAYPAYDVHASEHNWFLAHVSRLLENHAQGRTRLTLEVAQTLRPWLAEHVETQDGALVDYAQAWLPTSPPC